jgi:hypothetical protein
MSADDPNEQAATLHRQVGIDVGGKSIEVDEGLAALILALWERGYKTTGSCEHMPGTSVGVIAFDSERQAKDFSRIISVGKFFKVTQEDYDNAIATGATHEKATAFGEVGTPIVAFPAGSIDSILHRLEQS